MIKFSRVAWLLWFLIGSAAAGYPETAGGGGLAADSPGEIQLRLRGPMGERVSANLNGWLTAAPYANPGMLEMFRIRDRKPVPSLVPWAGEFVGKYLISAIQARRMFDPDSPERQRLDAVIQETIADLLSTQAEDGYLGPFRKEERLLGNWDLWGHYHVMSALWMWQAETGDAAARDAVLRAADLICRAFLDTGRRAREAGSAEMNMAVIHILARLYRDTGRERYLQMARVIEKDWEAEGDYARQGAGNVDFYRQPKPRWESLHDIQGLLELYRITGEEKYKTALVHIWRSIARFDRHNTGGFSTFEQAIGNPYIPGAIETCCTIAWIALSLDVLKLTGDSTVADELEWSTWNTVLGAQHPSGRWWTYDTPMDGERKASAHSIVFQARAGTPELNCCSVNGPRGLGMISEWAFLTDAQGVFVNYYGPLEADLETQGHGRIRLREETDYPAANRVVVQVTPGAPTAMTLRFRIPGWSKHTKAWINGEPVSGVDPGTYLALAREWRPGDRVELEFDFAIRPWVGDYNCSGKVSLFRGPLLLAFDPHFNAFDEDQIPALDAKRLSYSDVKPGKEKFPPLVLLEFQGHDDRPVRLCDFATAGAPGTAYRTWLPAIHFAPPTPVLKGPADGAAIPPGPLAFEWLGQKQPGRSFTLTFAEDPELERVVKTVPDIVWPFWTGDPGLESGRTYYWRVTARAAHGDSPSAPFPFHIDPALPNPLAREPGAGGGSAIREDGLIVASSLDGDGSPSYGRLLESVNAQPAADRWGNPRGALRFTGDGKLRYAAPVFPVEEYTFLAWICAEDPGTDRLAQVFSAWAKPGDDPLRVVVEKGRLFARIEGGPGAGTGGVPVTYGAWTHVAVVKSGFALALYVNGERRQEVNAPIYWYTAARDFALGANPHYSGNEYFVGALDDFAWYARVSSAEEITAIYREQSTKIK